MEIEKEVIRFSPEDVDTLLLYRPEAGDPETEDFIDGLLSRLIELQQNGKDEADNIQPIIEVPYSKRIIDLYTAALIHRQENTRQITDGKESETERLAKIRQTLARRPGFLNGTIVRLEDRRKR